MRFFKPSHPSSQRSRAVAKAEIEMKDLVIEALKSKGLNGLQNFEGDGCACRIDDLMPCDEPKSDCKACVLVVKKDCGVDECEWDGEEHFHEADESGRD
jgi:hypothetical protein